MGYNYISKVKYMAECEQHHYRTIRYMKASIIQQHVNSDEYKYAEGIKEKVNSMSENSMVGVRLRINSPVFIEKIIEIGKDDLSKLIEDIDPIRQ